MIQFSNVTKIYESTGTVALNNVSFQIAPGEFVFITGASGAGKSTITKLVIAEETCTQGEIYIAGVDVDALKKKDIPYYRRHIGMVFQHFRLISTKNVFENVAFALRIFGASEDYINYRVAEVLQLVDMWEKAYSMPDELSGGQQQRVSLARAIVNKPEVLIADEPTGNLDPNMTMEIMRLIDKISKTGTTVLVVTHDNSVVNKMKKRIIQLENGIIVRDDRRGIY